MMKKGQGLEYQRQKGPDFRSFGPFAPAPVPVNTLRRR